MRWEIILAPEAVEDLRRLSARHRANIRDALEQHLRYEPTKVSRSRIKKLRSLSKPQYRLRMDEFRVFYDVRESRIEVLAIVAKSSAAEWLAERGEEE
jgi:mRNA-degrading endonuclease RelE of RelBE toxin-antitoxin system